VGLEGGSNWAASVDAQQTTFYSTPPPTATAQFENEWNGGWAVIGTLGYAIDQHWRVEGEVGYRRNDIGGFNTLGGAPITAPPGELSQFSLMANVIYDVMISDKVTLSVGAGAGAARVNFTTPTIDVEDTNFAYQGIVGLNYAIGNRAQLFLNYRYFRVDGPDFNQRFSVGPTTNFALHYDDLVQHTVTLGLRFDLAADEEPALAATAPPPPPMSPPSLPPATGREFVVFFGLNKCNITAEANSVLQEAAAAAKSAGSASVRIVGHTDSAGSNSYNQKLSQCRASAARSALIADGIAESSISASGKGESELLVQTGDGVKEPQNRRASINLN
jgi:outer membrane protein OmpA-like peptidoglycan-associated protein